MTAFVPISAEAEAKWLRRLEVHSLPPWEFYSGQGALLLPLANYFASAVFSYEVDRALGSTGWDGRWVADGSIVASVVVRRSWEKDWGLQILTKIQPGNGSRLVHSPSEGY